MEVEDGVDDEEEVHGGDGDVVDDDVGQAPELLRVADGRDEERPEHQDHGEGGGCQQAVLHRLQDHPHQHAHHEERVGRGQDLRYEDLEVGREEVAGDHEEEDGDEVDEEGVEVADAEGDGEGAGEHHEDGAGTQDRAHHHHHLQLENKLQLLERERGG